MCSKVEIPSDVLSTSVAKEEMRRKEDALVRKSAKTVSLIVLTTCLIGIFIWQTVYLIKVSQRLSVLEQVAPTSSTGTMGENMENDHSARNRRSTSGNGGYGGSMPVELPSMLSSHLVSNKQAYIPKGNYINWDSNSPRLSHSDFLNTSDTFIKIPASGYYYVYTQLTLEINYSMTTGRQYGFQVTVHSGSGEHIPLLTVRSTLFPLRFGSDRQLQNPSLETKYTGGIFFLCRGDEVGVRADSGAYQGLDLVAGSSTIQSSSFFGLMATKMNGPNANSFPHPYQR